MQSLVLCKFEDAKTLVEALCPNGAEFNVVEQTSKFEAF